MIVVQSICFVIGRMIGTDWHISTPSPSSFVLHHVMLLLMNYFMMRPNDKLTNDKIDLKTTAAHRTMIDRK